MALALQCLQANRQAFVVSQQTKIGASDRSLRIVQGGFVILGSSESKPNYAILLRLIFYLTFVI